MANGGMKTIQLIGSILGILVILLGGAAGIITTRETAKDNKSDIAKQELRIKEMPKELQESLHFPWEDDKSGVMTRLDHLEKATEEILPRLQRIEANQSRIIAQQSILLERLSGD